MQRYEKYKDSGITWLGAIPEHWKLVKIKVVNKIFNGDSLNENQKKKYESDNPNQLPYISSKDISLDFSEVDYNNGLRIPQNESFKKAPKSSTLICIEGGSAGRKIAYTDQEVFFVNKLACLISSEEVYSRYIFYTLKGVVFQTQFNSSLSGLIGGVSISAIKNFLFTSPPLHEQQAIAAFLDEKCEKIDEIVNIKEQQIEKLKELRQITIHNAVTKGINSNAEMKESGIDWIGEIPGHWEMKANRAIFRERNEKGREGFPLLSVSIHSAVSTDEVAEELNIRGRIKIEDKSSYKLVKCNDIVFNMMRAWQGAIGRVLNEGMVSPAYIVAESIMQIDSLFIENQFRTTGYIESMNRVSRGITDFRKRLYWDQFKGLNTIIPPLHEQQEIVAYLEEKTSKIDQAIAQKQEQIAKLKDYKQSLINEVVTGKMKIKDKQLMVNDN